MKRLGYFTLSLSLLWMGQSGCYRTRIEMGGNAGWAAKQGHTAQENPGAQNEWEDGKFYHNFVYGLVDISGPIRLDRNCPQGVSYIDQRTSFLSGLVGGLTGGIYTPRYVQVVCTGN